MSGWPDHAAARSRRADDAGGGVEEAEPIARVEPVEPVGTRGPVGSVGSVGADGEADAAGVPGGAGAGAETAEDGRILADVAAIAAQRDEYLESLQRLKADFDNYRKRVARLQEEQSARAEANLVGKLLPVVDNLDLAWAHLGPRAVAGQGDSAPVSEEARAIAQARGQLLEVLGKEGLERVDAVGVPFDPTVHDAVAHADASMPPPPAGDDPAEGPVGRSGSAGDQNGSAGAEVGQGPGGGDGGAGGAGTGGSTGGSASAGPAVPHTVSVDEVLRAGYRWRGQVLRPAMVRVRG